MLTTARMPRLHDVQHISIQHCISMYLLELI